MAESKTLPWMKSQYYRVDGIPMVYETLTGITELDLIVDYTGKKWLVGELMAQGYRVEKPGTRRTEVYRRAA